MSDITDQRAARRFHQMRVIERILAIKSREIVECFAHLKELKAEHDALVNRLRTAARDEGELPLFDLDGNGEEAGR